MKKHLRENFLNFSSLWVSESEGEDSIGSDALLYVNKELEIWVRPTN